MEWPPRGATPRGLQPGFTDVLRAGADGRAQPVELPAGHPITAFPLGGHT